MRSVWDRHGGDVVAGARAALGRGRLELITCSATHCYLPGHDARRAKASARSSSSACAASSGSSAAARSGCGLPECAYHPSFDEEIARRRHSLHDRRHARRHARAPAAAVRRARADRVAERRRVLRARSPSRAARCGRATKATRATRTTAISTATSASTFRRASSMGEVAGDGSRLMTGLKYFRITGKRRQKQPYQPGRRARARRGSTRATSSSTARRRWTTSRARCPAPPIVVAPYDAELYGHWWFEGPHVPRGRVSPARDSTNGERRSDHAARIPRAASGRRAGDARARRRGAPAATARSGSARGGVDPGVTCTTRRDTRAGSSNTHRDADGRRGRRARSSRCASSCSFSRATGPSSSRRARRAVTRSRVSGRTSTALRNLGHFVENDVASNDDAKWLDDVCARDNFLWQLDSQKLRAPFD